jgi:transposase InsO family protein
VKYAWIEQQMGEHSLSQMCRVLEVSRSGYHAWRNRGPSQHAQDDEVLSAKVEEHFERGRGVYGTRRLKSSLAEEGIEVSRRRIGRLLDEKDLQVKTKRKFKPTTDSNHGQAVAANLLNRQFDVDTPNTAYVGDITYVWTDEGWLYLAIVIDLFSRAVVGWSMSRWLKADLANRALAMAIEQRQPLAGLIMHTDRGSQYVAQSYQQLLTEHQIRPSMSGKGDCWDNAVAESFFHTLKTECLYLERFETREQAREAIFEYIEVFYNRQRRHSTIGYQAPLVYEQAAAEATLSGE